IDKCHSDNQTSMYYVCGMLSFEGWDLDREHGSQCHVVGHSIVEAGKAREIGGSDSIKPVYHGHNNEDIEEFLEDYEAYVIRLHVSDNLKPWICEQIKAYTAWADLKDAIITGAQASCNKEEKLEQLKNIKQKSNDTIKAYTNQFDACIKLVENNIREIEK
ncbi:26425_t:CDS:2, partial [Gigaspora margarita]